MHTLILDGKSLTIAELVSAACNVDCEVVLADSAIAGINQSAAAVAAFVSEGKIAYGITTGFGAFKDKLIKPNEVEQLQENILLSHAVGVGDILDERATRAMMIIRANTLTSGYSGIRLETLRLLLALINHNILPRIPEKGSLGASGDLAPLAHMSLPLIGQGQVTYHGELMPASAALSAAGLSPLRLSAKEGLALTNGTTLMTALGVLAVHQAQSLMATANLAAALSLEAQNGTTAAFVACIHALRPQNFQQETAACMRALLEGSELVRELTPTNIQDAYTLRCIPQVHGAVHSAIDYAQSVMNIELNSVTDNPLLFFDENYEASILSGGNFHGEPLALALDFLNLALTDLGNISERRIAKLVDNRFDTDTYPPFLTQNGGLNSGFMLLQYTAAALTSENKTLSHPASTDSIPSSGNVEDHVSMGPNAALHSIEILKNLSAILAIELLSAAQAVDFRLQTLGEVQLGAATAKAYALIRTKVPFIPKDTLLHPYLEKLIAMVQAGNFSKIVFDIIEY